MSVWVFFILSCVAFATAIPCESADDCPPPDNPNGCVAATCVSSAQGEGSRECAFGVATDVEGCCEADSDCNNGGRNGVCEDLVCNLDLNACEVREKDCNDFDDTTSDMCVEGNCIYTPIGCTSDLDCNDGSSCTANPCNSTTGVCGRDFLCRDAFAQQCPQLQPPPYMQEWALCNDGECVLPGCCDDSDCPDYGDPCVSTVCDQKPWTSDWQCMNVSNPTHPDCQAYDCRDVPCPNEDFGSCPRNSCNQTDGQCVIGEGCPDCSQRNTGCRESYCSDFFCGCQTGPLLYPGCCEANDECAARQCMNATCALENGSPGTCTYHFDFQRNGCECETANDCTGQLDTCDSWTCVDYQCVAVHNSSNGITCPCVTAADCDDGLPCTVDECAEGQCSHISDCQQRPCYTDGVCNAFTGKCDYTPEPAGTPCGVSTGCRARICEEFSPTGRTCTTATIENCCQSVGDCAPASECLSVNCTDERCDYNAVGGQSCPCVTPGEACTFTNNSCSEQSTCGPDLNCQLPVDCCVTAADCRIDGSTCEESVCVPPDNYPGPSPSPSPMATDPEGPATGQATDPEGPATGATPTPTPSPTPPLVFGACCYPPEAGIPDNCLALSAESCAAGLPWLENGECSQCPTPSPSPSPGAEPTNAPTTPPSSASGPTPTPEPPTAGACCVVSQESGGNLCVAMANLAFCPPAQPQQLGESCPADFCVEPAPTTTIGGGVTSEVVESGGGGNTAVVNSGEPVESEMANSVPNSIANSMADSVANPGNETSTPSNNPGSEGPPPPKSTDSGASSLSTTLLALVNFY